MNQGKLMRALGFRGRKTPYLSFAIGIAVILTLCLTGAAQAGLDLTTIGVDNTVVPATETPLSAYRWVIEEDLTYHQNPDVIPPAINPDALGLNFHRSYMPLTAQGNNGLGESTSGLTLKPDTFYFVSVLPNNAESYAMGGTGFKTDAAGNASATVHLNKLPLPTAQIKVLVFHDTALLNNAWDLGEEGLEGFQVVLEEPAGRYGASGGQVQRDAFGNPLGTTYNTDGSVAVLGNGVITTNANGVAVIKNLPPGKYGVFIDPPETPPGEEWLQTTTIEGTQVIDAWVKANEPPFAKEFGPPGPHVFFGFVKEFVDETELTGGVTITGNVVSTHISRPPDYTFYPGVVFPDAFVGLNDMDLNRVVYVAKTTGDSEFAIPDVPPGNYQLVIWDMNLDIIVGFNSITVNADGATCAAPYADCNMGEVGVFDWFSRLEGRIFYDMDEDGFPDPGEGAFGPTLPVNIRWRDGTVYSVADNVGIGGYSFSELFPFFTWLVAEVDFGGPYKATGATVVIDAGGPVKPPDAPAFDELNEFAYPSYDRLTPQEQAAVNPHTGNNLSWTEVGEVITLAFQAFAGQTNVIHWGKVPYDLDVGENGGISGVVAYKTTRAEPDPENEVVQTWEPGIPNVQVNLYNADFNGNIQELNGVAGIQYADVDNYPFGWSEGGPMGPEDVERSGNDGIFDLGDATANTWTDSWDDNSPTDCPGDPADPFYADGKCYDGLRNFNQIRPGVYDGGYAFPGFNSNNPDGITPGNYVVEAVPPPAYKTQCAQDLNVVFGETYMPALDVFMLAFPLVPPCVGDPYVVGGDTEGHLALFYDPATPDLNVLHPWYDPESVLYVGDFDTNPITLNSCDRKFVQLTAGVNKGLDFGLLTEVPIAAHINGAVLNDLAAGGNPQNPNFGEKQALPHAPVSIRDWTGREITRVYTDQYGRYNALVPSTFTTNVPFPSGMSPNMLVACMNDPGPIPNPDFGLPDEPEYITDPHFNPQFTQFCYTLQFMPGVTTFLDTPVVPVAAFVGDNQAPLDCEFKDGTPVIRAVKGQDRTGAYVGPYLNSTGQLVITSLGDTAVTNPETGLPLIRDFGFGDVRGAGRVTLNGVPLPVLSWSNTAIVARVPRGYQGGQLMVSRDMNGQLIDSIYGVNVTIGPIAGSVIQVQPANGAGTVSRWPSTPIQDAIDASSPGDLILVDEGTYEELVVMYKPVQLQGAGAPATSVNAVKTPGEKLQAWRDKVAGLFDGGFVTALPGQLIVPDPDGILPGLLNTSEGPAIMVLAKDTDVLADGGFVANPNARVDGFTLQGSDVGGGLYVNGYARHLEVSNNRIMNNAGVNGGGITSGQPDLLAGTVPVDAQNDFLFIHHNHILENGSQSSGGGGVALYTGSNDYLVSDCWICGNFSQTSGGGVGHLGQVNDLDDDGWGGVITDNTIIFNQTFNQQPSARPSGGGIAIEGYSLAAQELSQGSGSVLIDDNLLQGNQAGAGDGGGINLYKTNGADVAARPRNPEDWHRILITNNMIVNNLAAKAGGGIAMQDVAYASIVNNTVANNDTTATAGDLIVLTASPGQLSEPQPAGIVSYRHSDGLNAAFNPRYTQTYSNPLLVNNIVWHNRSFFWTIDTDGIGALVEESPPYQDLAVLPSGSGSLNCIACFTSADGDPTFVADNFNTNGSLDIIPENQIPLTAAATDEGGNFIDVRFGPLTLWNPVTFDLFNDYHLLAGSPAVDAGVRDAGRHPTDPRDRIQDLVAEYFTLSLDFDEENRPNPNTGLIDIGADELY